MKIQNRPETKEGPGGEAPPGSNLAPLKFSELLFILLYLRMFLASQTLVYPPLPHKIFCPTVL